MVPGQRSCVLLALLFIATDASFSSGTCTAEGLLSSETVPPQALLQAHHTVRSASFVADAKEVDHKAATVKEAFGALTKINPSGAAAPLTNEGYLAVADRCCQAEMKQFIQRQIFNLGLQVCEDPGGLAGIVQYHSCPHGPQTFDKLTADLLADSLPRCRWLAPKSETCTEPLPEDCEKFEGTVPSECGCSRSMAAVLDLVTSGMPTNNLGGLGPGPGTDPEIRYSSGVSASGEAFDVVVTAIGSYTPKDSNKNGRKGGFGQINMMGNTSSNFRFSFVEPGTNTPVVLSEVHMATFDLDGSYSSGLESESSKGYYGYVTDANPSVETSLSPDGSIKFTGNGPTNLLNPTDPNTLNQDQRANSIMFFYKNVSSFEINFDVAVKDTTTREVGRNLFFAFGSSLNDRCGD